MSIDKLISRILDNSYHGHHEGCLLCADTNDAACELIDELKTNKPPMKKLPTSYVYHYSPEAMAASEKIPDNVTNFQSHKLGMFKGEPLLLILDNLLEYAKAYKVRFESPIAEDGFASDYWLSAITNVRGLFSCDGGVALRAGITTDSKDNGALEELFWQAMKVAGFTEEDLNR